MVQPSKGLRLYSAPGWRQGHFRSYLRRRVRPDRHFEQRAEDQLRTDLGFRQGVGGGPRFRRLRLGPGGAAMTAAFGVPSCQRAASMRSEEHTSELQSIMRISYAVFCLKKKK